MKSIYTLLAYCSLLLTVTSCGLIQKIEPVFNSVEEMNTLIADLKTRFGEQAQYNRITMLYDKSAANVYNLSVLSTENQQLLHEWQYTYGGWKKAADVTMTLNSGKPTDYVFTLQNTDLTKLVALAPDAKTQIATTRKIDPNLLTIRSVSVYKPNLLTSANDTRLLILVEKSENNETTLFKVEYDQNGKLKHID